MKKKAENIIIDYFNDKFGKLVGKQVFMQKLSELGISGFENLDMRQKISTGQDIIDKVFSEFYDKSKIQNLSIMYLLRFAMNEAVGTVEKMVGLNSEIKLNPMIFVPNNQINMVLSEINDQEIVPFGFESSNLLEGLLMFIMDKKTTVKFANVFMEAMTGESPSNYDLDDMKISSVFEFFNIVLPAFVKVIGDAYGQEVFFTPLNYDQFKTKYYFNGEFIVPQKTFRSRVSINLNNQDYPGKTFFFIKQSLNEFDGLVNQGTTKIDPFEESPPHLLIRLTGDEKTDILAFFGLLSLGEDHLSHLLKKISKQSLLNFEYREFVIFCQNLIQEFCPNASNNKKENIKYNITKILKVT